MRTRLTISESILLFAGALLLTGVLIVSQSGGWVVWTTAKALYAAGVLLLIINK